jgi:hypothetical protein
MLKVLELLNSQLPCKEVELYNGVQAADIIDEIRDNTFRDALESMSLALWSDGVSEDTIVNAVQTALDAYGNNC